MKVVGYFFDALLIDLEAVNDSSIGKNVRYSFGFDGKRLYVVCISFDLRISQITTIFLKDEM